MGTQPAPQDREERWAWPLSVCKSLHVAAGRRLLWPDRYLIEMETLLLQGSVGTNAI